MITFEYPEGATPLESEEIDGLKIKHITTRAELNRWEYENIQTAVAWLEQRRKKSAILNEKFICLLHKKMFGNVWNWAGQLRRTEKNIGIPWINISVELRNLITAVDYWIKNETYSSDEIAFRLHHKLVWIHLFPNGNGRHARLMTDALLKDVLKKETFSWGSENLTDAGVMRKKYITALKQADNHNYKALAAFVRT